ncbi:MAG: hypothetical protein ACO3J6_11410, partial [Opitutales bacterium]
MRSGRHGLFHDDRQRRLRAAVTVNELLQRQMPVVAGSGGDDSTGDLHGIQPPLEDAQVEDAQVCHVLVAGALRNVGDPAGCGQ